MHATVPVVLDYAAPAPANLLWRRLLGRMIRSYGWGIVALIAAACYLGTPRLSCGSSTYYYDAKTIPQCAILVRAGVGLLMLDTRWVWLTYAGLSLSIPFIVQFVTAIYFTLT